MLGEIFIGVGNFAGSILGVFDNGLKAFASVKERLFAIGQIGKETVNDTQTTISTDTAKTLEDQSKQAVSKASLALLIAGILGVILVFMIIRRKTR